MHGTHKHTPRRTQGLVQCVNESRARPMTLFQAYGAIRAVHCTPELFGLLKL